MNCKRCAAKRPADSGFATCTQCRAKATASWRAGHQRRKALKECRTSPSFRKDLSDARNPPEFLVHPERLERIARYSFRQMFRLPLFG